MRPSGKLGNCQVDFCMQTVEENVFTPLLVARPTTHGGHSPRRTIVAAELRTRPRDVIGA